MSTQLKTGRNWTNHVRVADETPRLDIKNNPVHKTVTGKLIRDIQNGDFDNIANLQIAAGIVSFKDNDTNGRTVLGYTNVTTMYDSNTKTEHVVEDDPALVKTYCEQGFTITKTERKEMLG